jgi:putative oxygen-independent coproporphyrinogen III oxidase
MEPHLRARLSEGTRPGLTGPVLSAAEGLSAPPPLALYVHIPWCLRKCPYCDFNSRALRENLPEAAYVERLLLDLGQEAAALSCARPLTSIFIGGGTPSLLSGSAIASLLRGVRDLMELCPDAEITLEANPGATDAERFAAYGEAGVNRLSIGAQSLSATHLERLGRIHGPRDVRSAVAQARWAGFTRLNLDLMYGLPEQSLPQACRDLREALALEPEHISYYQLTLETNTAFHRDPPRLPDEDLIADMQEQGAHMLASSGFRRYEVSAYARTGQACQHNLGYWEFGDYLGIGAGAHGKLTDPAENRVERRWKLRDPTPYLDPVNRDRLVSGKRTLSDSDLVLEFAMNGLRLLAGFHPALFESRTGLPFDRIAGMVEDARSAGLLVREGERVMPTELGYRFLNDLLQYFARD